jgi:hypothetical protein
MIFLKANITQGCLEFSYWKPYNEQKGIPSPIGDDGGLPTNGQNVPISNGSGGPFDIGGNGPLGDGRNSPPRGGDSGSLGAQNPRSYSKGLVGSWMGPTWNLWYPQWYHVQPPITTNPPLNKKSLP